MQTVTIVGMVYKSVEYLDFMVREIEEYCLPSQQYNVDYVVVANDATQPVLDRVWHHPHLVYNDPEPDAYYLNRVYRAWNFGGFNAPGEIIVFVNSDMAFSEGWLEALLEQLTPDTIPCSRLCESEKMRSGRYGMGKNFGRSPAEFNRPFFDLFVHQMKRKEVKKGGLYMPCAFYKKDFVESGGYPEGNVYQEGVGKFGGHLIMTGDDYLFHETMGHKQHVTVFDSIVYHIQEGEMDA